jgi:hypothetical protein
VAFGRRKKIQQHPIEGKRTLIESNGYPIIEAVSACQGGFFLGMVNFLENKRVTSE